LFKFCVSKFPNRFAINHCDLAFYFCIRVTLARGCYVCLSTKTVFGNVGKKTSTMRQRS